MAWSFRLHPFASLGHEVGAKASYIGRWHRAGDASFMWIRTAPFIVAERPAIRRRARDFCNILFLFVLCFLYRICICNKKHSLDMYHLKSCKMLWLQWLVCTHASLTAMLACKFSNGGTYEARWWRLQMQCRKLLFCNVVYRNYLLVAHTYMYTLTCTPSLMFIHLHLV
jgi:hypothetical protein